MKSKIRVLILISLLTISFKVPLIAFPGQLLKLANKEIRLAQDAEAVSYPRAFEHYANAATVADKIVEKHPRSKIARRLLTGEKTLGPYTYKDLKEKVLPKMSELAGAETDLLNFGYFFSSRISNDERYKTLLILVAAYEQADNQPMAVTAMTQFLKSNDDPETKLQKLVMGFQGCSKGEEPPDPAFDVKYSEEPSQEKAEQAKKELWKALVNIGIEAARAIPDPNSEFYFLDQAVSISIEEGNTGKARELITAETGLLPSLKEQADGEMNIAVNYAKLGDFDMAFGLTKDIGKRDKQLEADEMIIGIYFEADGRDMKTFDWILQKINEQTDSALQAALIGILASGYSSDKGKIDLSAFPIMIGEVEKIKGAGLSREKIEALSSIATAYAKSGGKDDLILKRIFSSIDQMADTLEGEGKEKSEAIQTVVSACKQSGYRDARLLNKLFNIWLGALDGIKEEDARADAVKSIADSYIDSGQKNGNTLDRIENQAKKIKDAQTRDEVLSELADRYADAGMAERALRIALLIKDAKARNDALSEIALKCIEQNRFEQGLKAARGISKPEDRFSALLCPLLPDCLSSSAQKPDRLALEKYLDQVSVLASQIKDAKEKDKTLASIAVIMASNGRIERALALFKKVKDEENRQAVFEGIAGQYLKQGGPDKALDLARKEGGGTYLGSVAFFLAGDGKYEQALGIVSEIKDSEPRFNALDRVASSFLSSKEKEKVTGERIWAMFAGMEEWQDAVTPAGIAGYLFSQSEDKSVGAQKIIEVIDRTTKIEDSEKKADALNTIVSEYRDGGGSDPLIYLKIIESAGTINSASLLQEILYSCTSKGGGNAELFAKLMIAAQGIKCEDTRYSTQARIAARFGGGKIQVDNDTRKLLHQILASSATQNNP